AVALLSAGCSSGPEQPDTVAGEFVEALNRDDLPAAAALTDNPAQAGDALRGLYEGLGSEVVFRVDSADDDRFTLAATWKLGKDGKNEWTYTTTGTAAESGDDWKIDWNPATVAPGLEKGPLSY
ncbi:NTF2-like N-terminal transpeptidase domain-containing protein, partial [Nocardia farcinica]